MTTYITTPIYYVNANPHLGHAYTSVIADTYSRYQRLQDPAVRFQTGTDEHGEKIAQAAAAEQVTPAEYATRISKNFEETWPTLGVKPDHFIRTTQPEHIKTVQAILQATYNRGDIYFSEYTGLYCQGCERFLTEKELKDGLCPDHQKPPEPITEQNYFFKMSKYQDWLIDHIKNNPDFITPTRYRNEVLSFLKDDLEDLCISRPVSRLTWGIPLPFDDRFVTYVWYDALINYLTGLGYPDQALFKTYWPAAEHVIAKDILKPHAIFWPTMLRSMEIPLYQRLHVHGYWNVEETKMSKSIGNVVRPLPLVEKYGVDTVRYFLLREMSFGLDASFSDQLIEARHNSDLANDLGNLVSRSLAMIGKYCAGQVPAYAQEQRNAADQALVTRLTQMVESYQQEMTAFNFHRALQAVWEVISHLNKFIVTNEPWALAQDPAKTPRLHTVLYALAESLRIIALLLRPVMPTTADKIYTALGLDSQAPLQPLAIASQWGQLVPGTQTQPPPQLFPRLVKPKKHPPQPVIKTAKKDKVKKATKPEVLPEGIITFDQFMQVSLCVGKITAAEKVKKANKLLKLTVLAPEERTVVAGIAKFYEPEALIGQSILLVANLKPRQLMGLTSQGMILAAKDTDGEGQERLTLCTVPGEVTPGSSVS